MPDESHSLERGEALTVPATSAPSDNNRDAADAVDATSLPALESRAAEPSPAAVPVASSSSGAMSAASAPASDDGAAFGLTRGDRLAVTGIAVVMLALIGAHWARLSGWGTHEVEIERLTPRPVSFRLDVNTANWVELSQLDGLGEALARRIVESRERDGPFTAVDDLRRVKGIGEKTLGQVRPWLTANRQE